jgi:hypothetical protein
MRKAFLRSAFAFMSMGLAFTCPAADRVRPPDSLVAENIPPIPASVAESVGRYTEFRAAQFRSWHPTRREMLIRTRFADTLQIHRVRMPLGARQQVTFFPDSVASATFQPTGGEYFVFNRTLAGTSSRRSSGTTWAAAT